MAKDPDPDPETAAVFNAVLSAHSKRVSRILIEILQQSPEHLENVGRKLLLPAGLLKGIAEALPDDEQPKRPECIADIQTEDAKQKEEESAQSELSEPETNDTAASGRKRKRMNTRQRHEICKNCEKEYDVTLNRNDSCGYHSGKFEIDLDSYYWKEAYGSGELDLEVECEDTEWMRENHPGGYSYSCCLGYEPCMTGGHQPDRSKRSRKW